jgi:cell division protein FtsA
MKNTNDYLAAIDIGTTKIVTIIGKMNENNKLDILSLSKTESTGVKRGLVTNIEETVNAIAKSVEEAKLKAGVSFDNVFVGIAGQHIRSVRNRNYRIIQSPDNEITRDDLKVLLSDMYNMSVEAGEEILHIIPQNYIVDLEADIRNPIGMSGKRLEGNFHIVIGNVNSARNIEKCVNRVNLKLNKLILEPLASSAAVLTDEEKEAGVALVDIGGGTTDIAVYYEGIVWHTAVIPFGGNVITKDIREGCSILPTQAEKLKISCGTCLPEAVDSETVIAIEGSGRGIKEISYHFLAGIINARMEEIIDAVTFEMESSGVMDKLSAGIVITGGGSLMRDLPQLIKFKTGMDVRIGYPCEQLSANTSEDINHPMYATAIGLILRGYEYCEENNRIISAFTSSKKENDALVDEADETEENTESKKGFGLFKNFKKIQDRMMDMFEENDAKM